MMAHVRSSQNQGCRRRLEDVNLQLVSTVRGKLLGDCWRCKEEEEKDSDAVMRMMAMEEEEEAATRHRWR
eukprot:634495-Rhodomonas_salina.1